VVLQFYYDVFSLLFPNLEYCQHHTFSKASSSNSFFSCFDSHSFWNRSVMRDDTGVEGRVGFPYVKFGLLSLGRGQGTLNPLLVPGGAILVLTNPTA